MQTRRAFFLTLISAAVASGWARAEALTEADRAALAALFQEWEEATFAGDFNAMMRTMPPALWQRIAELSGVPLEDAVQKLDTLFADLMPTDLAGLGVKITYDWSRTNFGETSTGRPFVVIPRTLSAGTLTMETPVLAIRDDGRWYAVQVDNLMIRAMLLQAYPDLASIDFSAFPEPTMTFVE